MRNFFVSIIILFAVNQCFAQTSEQTIDRIIEKIFDYISDETEQAPEFELLYDNLTQFYSQKINLNQTTKEELEKLQFLSDLQIENLLAYIYANKQMHTIYELQLVEGFDWFSIELLLPFVTVQNTENQSNKWDFKQIFRRTTHEFVVRTDGTVEQKKGYIKNEQTSESQYLGSPFYELFRYSFKAGDRVQAGFVAEKDAGEQFWGKHNKGFDFYGAYLQINKLWKFDRIVVGDFRATFGQGLIMNGAFSAGKSSYVLKVTPQSQGLVKKSGTDEFNFFRGVGATAIFGKFSVTALYSFRKMNADTTGGSFTTFKADGLFRQASDFDRKNSVTRQVLAANITYRHQKFKIGATYYQSWLNVPLIPNSEPYKLFAFSGLTQSGVSADYYFRLKKFTFFGETALSNRLAVATINGVVISPVSTANFVLVQRYFSKDYDLFFAKAFGKSSSVGNESGIYFGAEISPLKRWKIAAYGDIFKFAWLQYQVSAPANGFDALLQTDFLLNRNAEMYLRAKFGNNAQNFNDLQLPTRQVGELKKMAIRYNINYKFGKFSFRSLVEMNFAKEPQMPVTQGFSLLQDAAYSIDWHNFSVALRYLFFDAKDYNNRFYFSERDVPYSMSSPVFYGIGNRYAINIKFEIINDLALYLRWAQTIYADNRTETGTALEQISGHVKSDFKILLKWNFAVKVKR